MNDVKWNVHEHSALEEFLYVLITVNLSHKWLSGLRKLPIIITADNMSFSKWNGGWDASVSVRKITHWGEVTGMVENSWESKEWRQSWGVSNHQKRNEDILRRHWLSFGYHTIESIGPKKLEFLEESQSWRRKRLKAWCESERELDSWRDFTLFWWLFRQPCCRDWDIDGSLMNRTTPWP